MIGLQTAFGGGKTHTMLAVYHLARHLNEGGDPADLPGLAPVVSGLGNVSWRKPQACGLRRLLQGHGRVADVEGRAAGFARCGAISPGASPATPGSKLVAEAEAARTNPGSELMVEVFRLAGPSVILLDELVMFARQLR